ncbi:MAG: hypothetical protein DHS80DRAFT_22971 [Piptocephalis tieghemiana]|nr:MAG: hypothetical protein DHS80DRAFT_22971 [Piptocephalis tieghemiana]
MPLPGDNYLAQIPALKERPPPPSYEQALSPFDHEDPPPPVYTLKLRKYSKVLEKKYIPQQLFPFETIRSASISMLLGKSIKEHLTHYFHITSKALDKRCDYILQGRFSSYRKDAHLQVNPGILQQIEKDLCTTLLQRSRSMDSSRVYRLMVNTAKVQGYTASNHLGLLRFSHYDTPEREVHEESVKALESLYTDYYSLNTLPLLYLKERMPLIEESNVDGNLDPRLFDSLYRHKQLFAIFSNIKEDGEIEFGYTVKSIQKALYSRLEYPQGQLAPLLTEWISTLHAAPLLASHFMHQIHLKAPDLLERTSFSPDSQGSINKEFKRISEAIMAQGVNSIRQLKHKFKIKMTSEHVEVLRRHLLTQALPILDGLLALLDLCKKLFSVDFMLRSIPQSASDGKYLASVITSLWNTASLTHSSQGKPFGRQVYDSLSKGERQRLGLSPNANIPWIIVMHHLIKKHAILLWSTIWSNRSMNRVRLSKLYSIFQGREGEVPLNAPLITLLLGFILSLLRLAHEQRSWGTLDLWLLYGLTTLWILRSKTKDPHALYVTRLFTYLFPHLEAIVIQGLPEYSRVPPLMEGKMSHGKRDFELRHESTLAYQALLKVINRHNGLSPASPGVPLPPSYKELWSKYFEGEPFGWTIGDEAMVCFYDWFYPLHYAPPPFL